MRKALGGRAGNLPVGGRASPFALVGCWHPRSTDDYQKKASDIAHVRAAVAGERLGASLNAALAGP
jgi:hypothetical protein